MPEYRGKVERIDAKRQTVTINKFTYRVTGPLFEQFIKYYPVGSRVKGDAKMGWIKNVVSQDLYK